VQVVGRAHDIPGAGKEGVLYLALDNAMYNDEQVRIFFLFGTRQPVLKEDEILLGVRVTPRLLQRGCRISPGNNSSFVCGSNGPLVLAEIDSQHS